MVFRNCMTIPGTATQDARTVVIVYDLCIQMHLRGNRNRNHWSRPRLYFLTLDASERGRHFSGILKYTTTCKSTYISGVGSSLTGKKVFFFSIFDAHMAVMFFCRSWRLCLNVAYDVFVSIVYDVIMKPAPTHLFKFRAILRSALVFVRKYR